MQQHSNFSSSSSQSPDTTSENPLLHFANMVLTHEDSKRNPNPSSDINFSHKNPKSWVRGITIEGAVESSTNKIEAPMVAVVEHRAWSDTKPAPINRTAAIQIGTTPAAVPSSPTRETPASINEEPAAISYPRRTYPRPTNSFPAILEPTNRSATNRTSAAAVRDFLAASVMNIPASRLPKSRTPEPINRLPTSRPTENPKTTVSIPSPTFQSPPRSNQFDLNVLLPDVHFCHQMVSKLSGTSQTPNLLNLLDVPPEKSKRIEEKSLDMRDPPFLSLGNQHHMNQKMGPCMLPRTSTQNPFFSATFVNSQGVGSSSSTSQVGTSLTSPYLSLSSPSHTTHADFSRYAQNHNLGAPPGYPDIIDATPLRFIPPFTISNQTGLYGSQPMVGAKRPREVVINPMQDRYAQNHANQQELNGKAKEKMISATEFQTWKLHQDRMRQVAVEGAEKKLYNKLWGNIVKLQKQCMEYNDQVGEMRRILSEKDEKIANLNSTVELAVGRNPDGFGTVQTGGAFEKHDERATAMLEVFEREHGQVKDGQTNRGDGKYPTPRE